MPKLRACKKDSKSTYKGDEPSPKGLGYCAHSEKLGTKMKGKDGNMWIIKETSSKIKRWVKLKSEKKGKKYYILHNGSLPFEVFINGKEVSIYKREKYDGRKHGDRIEYRSIPYDILVKKYKAKKIYLGKDKSIGKDYIYGKYGIGNSMLLDMGEDKYVCISPLIFEFNTEPNDKFVKFSSLIVDSDNPDPILITKNNFYTLVDLEYTSLDNFPKDWKIDDWRTYYNGTWDGKKRKFIGGITDKKKLKGLKKIDSA